jgi:hypothetical protein
MPVFAEAEMSPWLRQTDDPIVALGPALQPFRGLLFAIAFYPLREVIFGRKHGWLVLWLVLVVVGIFSTFGPTPGSIEGLIYTTISPGRQLGGLVEVLLQSLLLSSVLCFWIDHAGRRWLAWVLGILMALAVLLSITGFVMAGSAAS